MKKLCLIFMISALTLVWACPMKEGMGKSHCASSMQGKKHKGHFLKGIQQAIKTIGKEDDKGITLALYSYKMKMKSSSKMMNLDAFTSEGFDADIYKQNSRLHLKLEAQSELLSSIYGALNAEEKKSFVSALKSIQETRAKQMRCAQACSKHKGSCKGKQACHKKACDSQACAMKK
jgi:hypothetical protein